MHGRHEARFAASLGLLVMVGLVLVAGPWSGPGPVSEKTQGHEMRRWLRDFGKAPIRFELNVGQMDPRVRYMARASNFGLFLTGDGAVLSLRNPSRGTRDVIRMGLAGGNPRPRVEGLGRLKSQANYFIGENPTQWRHGVPMYSRVRYRDVYPKVDLIYYSRAGQIEYDLVLQPGGSLPEDIRLRFEGVEGISIDSRGDLLLRTQDGQVRQQKPFIYQQEGEGRRSIDGEYVLLASNQVGFRVPSYDPRLPLVIDPPLNYSTFLGGSGDETGNAIAVDADGNAYVSGVTASSDFPTEAALQGDPGGNNDVFITKLNPDGSGVIFSTFLGGTGDDVGNGIALDSSGNVYVAGETRSSDFPIEAAVQDSFGGGDRDCFAAKLTPNGDGLVYSTYLGADDNDRCTGVAADPSENTYVSGVTESEDFPVTPFAVQTDFGLNEGGDEDGFLAKLGPEGTLIYATFLGGGGDDGAEAVVADSQGNAYVTGYTKSDKFPTLNPQQDERQGDRDAFVSRLSSDGSSFVFSTFLGGNDDDTGRAITLDRQGNVYVAGISDSGSFPLSSNAFQQCFGQTTDAFAAKYTAMGQGMYSTCVGGFAGDAANGVAVDPSGNAAIVGVTRSEFFPVTDDAFQFFPGGGETDGFVTILNEDGSAQVQSTFLGGGGEDEAKAVATDGAGGIYVTGFSESDLFPITEGAFQTTRDSAEVFIAKFGLNRATVVSSANFDPVVAPDSLASLFGQGWAEETLNASPGQPLPFVLGGVRVTLTDSEGTEFPAPLVLVAPLQINFLAPDRIGNGEVTAAVTRDDELVALGTVEIAGIAPGIYSANGDGQGVAAAIVLRRNNQGGDTQEFVFQGQFPNRTPRPINLGPASDELFLILFGTGIRGGGNVTVTFNGIPGNVLFFGDQMQFEGLDQINVRMPREQLGSGFVNVVASVDGMPANRVTIRIQ